jgi:hypothetical protein
MTRSKVLFASAVFLASLAVVGMPAGTSAHGYGYGYDKDDDLGWAIISGDDTNISDMRDLDSMDDLKARFGDEFLYIRLDESRYVIRDRGLIKRAEDAAGPMKRAAKEIGMAAKMQAKAALSESRGAARHQRLEHARTKAAEDRLHKEVQRLNQEMRDILRDAKARRLAERLD